MQRTTDSNSLKNRPAFLKDSKEGVILSLHIQPRASKNEITGIHGETALKVRLTSPPVEGAANAACMEFLAAILEIRKSQIEITSGQKSRTKQLKITGVSWEEVGGKIFKYLAQREKAVPIQSNK